MNAHNVLVVDDDFVSSATIDLMLKKLNLNVTICKNVEEALTTYTNAHNSIDTVIVDNNLPDGNGVDLLSKLDEIDCKLFSILLSGDISNETKEHFLDIGGNIAVQKPISFYQLKEILEN